MPETITITPEKKPKRKLRVPIIDWLVERPLLPTSIFASLVIVHTVYKMLAHQPSDPIDYQIYSHPCIANPTDPLNRVDITPGISALYNSLKCTAALYLPLGVLGWLRRKRETGVEDFMPSDLFGRPEEELTRKQKKKKTKILSLEERLTAEQERRVKPPVFEPIPLALFGDDLKQKALANYNYDCYLQLVLEQAVCSPKGIDTRIELIKAYVYTGQIDKTLKNIVYLTELREKQGRDFSFIDKYVTWYISLISKDLCRRYPGRVEYPMLLSLAPAFSGNYAEAAQNWEQKVQYSPQNVHPILSFEVLANLYKLAGNTEAEHRAREEKAKAISRLDKSLFQKREGYSVWTLRGEHIVEYDMLIKISKDKKSLEDELRFTQDMQQVFDYNKKTDPEFYSKAKNFETAKVFDTQVQRFGEDEWSNTTGFIPGKTLRDHLYLTGNTAVLEEIVRFTAQLNALCNLEAFDYIPREHHDFFAELQSNINAAAQTIDGKQKEEFLLLGKRLLGLFKPLCAALQEVSLEYLVVNTDPIPDNAIISPTGKITRLDFQNKGRCVPQWEISKIDMYGIYLTDSKKDDKLRDELLRAYIETFNEVSGKEKLRFQEFKMLKLAIDPLRALITHFQNMQFRPELIGESAAYLSNARHSLARLEHEFKEELEGKAGIYQSQRAVLQQLIDFTKKHIQYKDYKENILKQETN